eukprot:jgi/Botrbrau1/15716/Bobra.4_1s0086.1
MELILKTAHQSFCPRLVQYWSDKDLAFFPPEGLGTEVVELGPRSNKAGPNLLLIRGVQQSPAWFLQWFKCSILPTVIQRYFWLSPTAPVIATKEELLEALSGLPIPHGSVRLQTHPPGLTAILGDESLHGWDLNPRTFQEVLSVVQLDDGFRYSLLPAEEVYFQSDNSSVTPSKRGEACSKAVAKLQEALMAVGKALPALHLALDLGAHNLPPFFLHYLLPPPSPGWVSRAAPGGWTQFLAGRSQQVVAIDPADLDAEVAALPNVAHLKCTSDVALSSLLAMAEGRADLLTCDMNQQCFVVLEYVRQLLPAVRSGGYIIVTMKFAGVGRERDSMVEKAQEKLGPSVVVLKCIWLLSNTVTERTLLIRKL